MPVDREVDDGGEIRRTKKQLAKDTHAASVQKSLASDVELNKEFDKLSKYASAPPSAKIPRAKKRRRGRPSSGRIILQQSRIDTLPQFGYPSEVARRLGIKHTTLQQWCSLDDHPLPFSKKDGRKVFRKDVLIEWLVATKRFTIKPEYGN